MLDALARGGVTTLLVDVVAVETPDDTNIIIGRAPFRARATDIAQSIGTGHSFVVLLRNELPINAPNPLKRVPEVYAIVCATANPIEALVAITERGREIVGVIDGSPPLGFETDVDVAERHSLLRHIGNKL